MTVSRKASLRGKLVVIDISPQTSQLIRSSRINHEHLSQQALSEAIRKFRLDNSSTVQSTRDIQTWDAPNDSGAGCVSQFLHFTDTNKETGVATKMTTLLIANIQVIDGQKKLSELTEVMKASS